MQLLPQHPFYHALVSSAIIWQGFFVSFYIFLMGRNRDPARRTTEGRHSSKNEECTSKRVRKENIQARLHSLHHAGRPAKECVETEQNPSRKARAEKAATGFEMCFLHWRPFQGLDPEGGRIKNKKRTERHSRPLAWQFSAQQ